MNAVSAQARAHIGSDLLDVERVRRDFPILARAGERQAALLPRQRRLEPAPARRDRRDLGTTTRRPRERAPRRARAEPGSDRAVRGCARQGARVSSTRARHEEIVFVRGTTEAINLVAQSFGRPRFAPGDEILISWLEHHANIVPWQMLCEQTGAALKVVPITRSRRGRFRRRSSDCSCRRTRLVALAHVSNALGTIVPVERFIAAARTARRSGAARRRAGRAAHARRRAGARLRLLLLLGPQDVRPDRDRRAVRRARRCSRACRRGRAAAT